jgi:hypothetical protein
LRYPPTLRKEIKYSSCAAVISRTAERGMDRTELIMWTMPPTQAISWDELLM